MDGQEVVGRLNARAPCFYGTVLRRHKMHQTASAACRATAGHVRTPTSFAPAPAFARTATETPLYSSIATTNPRAARFGPSLRASQQAQPNESKAAPAIRATTSAAGASSDAPSKNVTTSVGNTSNIKPVAVSTNAVTISSVLATTSRRTDSIGAAHFVGEYRPTVEQLHRAVIAVEECRKGTDLRL